MVSRFFIGKSLIDIHLKSSVDQDEMCENAIFLVQGIQCLLGKQPIFMGRKYNMGQYDLKTFHCIKLNGISREHDNA